MSDDLSDFETAKFADAGSPCPLLNPKTNQPMINADGTPMTITVYGNDGERFAAARRARQDMRIKQRRTGRLSVAEVENDNLEILVGATASWNISRGGKKVEFSPDNVRALYTELPWVRRQVDAWMAEEANFSGASPTT